MTEFRSSGTGQTAAGGILAGETTRREFLRTTTGGLLAATSGSLAAWGAPAPPGTTAAATSSSESGDRAEPVSFFVVSDTHFLANKEQPSRLDEQSRAVTGRLVDWLNRLAGTAIPEAAGGGVVRTPRGVLHGGDCIDTGDKPFVEMQKTEWAGFVEAYGLTGREGQLKYPVYEVHGNHDSPRGDGYAVQQMMLRNPNRAGVKQVSPNNLHYSWDWNGVHFVSLGIVVGETAEVARTRRYAPLGSLEFLQKDLAENVGNSGRPIVLLHHIDCLRYAQPLPVEDQKAKGMEWDPADVQAYYRALKGYSVAAILYGHTHARNMFRWDGGPRAAATGIPTFNIDNSSHFHGTQQAFCYFEIGREGTLVREFQTSDAWETGRWAAQTWSTPFYTVPT